MSTLGHSPNFRGVLSDTRRIIRANYCHFLVLSILFLLPLSTAFMLYPTLIATLSASNSITAYYQLKPHIILNLVYILFVLLFFIFAAASITYSTFHGFYNRPVSFISSVKSIVFSFFPLLLTVIASEMILILFFVVIGLLGALLYKGFAILGIDVSNYLPGSVDAIGVSILVATVFPQSDWSLAYVVVVVEYKWGFAALKRSAYLIRVRGMSPIDLHLKIMLCYGMLPAVLVLWCALLLGGTNRSWAAMLEVALCSFLAVMMMLCCVVAFTLLYIYCLALPGEMALEVVEEPMGDCVSLPVDDRKD